MIKICSRCEKKFEKNNLPLKQYGRFRKLCDSCLFKARRSRKEKRLKEIIKAIDDYEIKMDNLFHELRNKIYAYDENETK